MSAICIQNLSFAYTKGEPVLDMIDMEVPRGSIYGFLGANGAGKSTTLRLILGLMTPNAGSIKMFDEDITKTYPAHLMKVGSMIESASLYEHLSAKDNLRIAGKYFSVPKNRIEPILELVKLQDAKKKKVKDFSTGMKQRLGLALALQHDPELLILDEPTNGLDPNGIIELREVIFKLKDQGKTILLSSHILSEVEKIVSKVGIINNGKIAFEGSMQELQSLKTKNSATRIHVSDVKAVINLYPDISFERIGDSELDLTIHDKDQMADMVKNLVEHDISIYSIVPIASDLENMFLTVTKD